MNQTLVDHLNANDILYSLRVSIKCFHDGRIETDRKTYCFRTKLLDGQIGDIISILTSSESAKKFILRRTNEDTTFIVSIDNDKTLKFYLDRGFRIGEIGMVSIEIGESEKIREYMTIPYNPKLIPDYFQDVRDYVSHDFMLKRDDGQLYSRVKSSFHETVYTDICDDPTFVDFVSKYSDNPLWFQVCDDSFTFYFLDN